MRALLCISIAVLASGCASHPEVSSPWMNDYDDVAVIRCSRDAGVTSMSDVHIIKGDPVPYMSFSVPVLTDDSEVYLAFAGVRNKKRFSGMVLKQMGKYELPVVVQEPTMPQISPAKSPVISPAKPDRE